jgi:ubiquinone/menaquinone biosynthesis C-methylase UbiE
MKDRTASQRNRFFNRLATQGWHKSNFFTYTWKYPALRRWLADQILPGERRILSIGCGSGEIERDLSKKGLTVVGVDVSHDMLRAAERRGLKNLVQADAGLLPFSDGYFDLLMFMESVGYFDLGTVLKETKRVLRRSGRVIMTAYPPHHDSDAFCRKVGLPEIVRDLRQTGFHILARQMLTVNRRGVVSVPSEKQSTLLFASARKKA